MAESYESFAQVYDELMDNVPYKQWAEFIEKYLKENGISDGLVCDLGCGTGNMTMLLSKAGYDMIGIDNSEEMLMIAREKQMFASAEDETVSSILYLLQDMTEFELYGTVRACISVCDCVNYLLEEEQLLDMFKAVNNYLDPKGVFLFDFNTTYKYREVIGETVIAENREDCSFIWENFYSQEDEINEYDLTIFVEQEDNLFQKFTETHYQRGYTLQQMKDLLGQAGLVFEKALDMDTKGEVTDTTQRIFVIAREQGK